MYSLDDLKEWVAGHGAVSIQNMVALTPNGRSVKYASLHAEVSKSPIGSYSKIIKLSCLTSGIERAVHIRHSSYAVIVAQLELFGAGCPSPET